jgi:hypothetical protein
MKYMMPELEVKMLAAMDVITASNDDNETPPDGRE